MTQFIYHKAGNTEAQQKQALAFLLQQDSPGLASDGVLSGLGVSQTATASASVVVAAGSGASQDTVLNGASMLVLDSPFTLDVLGANPVGGLPRNDVVVFDAATVSSGAGGVRVLTGVPNASPTDPTVPATAVPLARLRHAASATTVPASAIDDLRVAISTADPTLGWVSVPLASGVSGTLKMRRRGLTVDIAGDITKTSFTAGFNAASATGALPVAARPTITPPRGVAYMGSGTVLGTVEVGTDGTVNVQCETTRTLAKFNFSYPAG